MHSSCVGVHEAFGSRAWNVGTVQLTLRLPERSEVGVVAEAKSIYLGAASSRISADKDVI